MTRKVHERIPAGLTLALVISGALVQAQAVDDTQLKQVIIFGRHSVRAAVTDIGTLNTYSAKPFPSFGVGTGILTPNGAKLETILGGYYRLWLTNEKLLTGNDSSDANFVYFRANVIERTIATAQALAAGMLPAASVNVNHFGPTEADPLFEPMFTGTSVLDLHKSLAAVQGRLGANGESLTAAYAAELALTRSVLFGYPASQTPAPAAPTGIVDVTTIPIDVTLGTAGSPVNLGGLTTITAAVDPFIMEYADGMPAADVGWGQLTAAGISQIMRLYTLDLDLTYRTPYVASVLSSNVASHVMRSMVQAATGNAMTGALGNPSTKVIALIASDGNIAAYAGLFHLDWILPGYQADTYSPGGAVVFQLRQSQSTGEYIVRASYIAQTLDQLRNLTILTVAAPPAIAPLFIPGCSIRNATFDCPLESFVRVATHAIDPHSVDLVN
jgi:4-phytase/acid phosphatase